MTAQSALLLAAVGTVAENPTIRASPCFDSAPAYGSLAKFQQFSFVSPGQGEMTGADLSLSRCGTQSRDRWGKDSDERGPHGR